MLWTISYKDAVTARARMFKPNLPPELRRHQPMLQAIPLRRPHDPFDKLSRVASLRPKAACHPTNKHLTEVSKNFKFNHQFYAPSVFIQL